MTISIEDNVPLAEKTWFKTGGPARFYTEPHSKSDFQEALMYAQHYNLPLFILGEGANILISDEGFDGLVIKPRITTLEHWHTQEGSFVKAGAGVTFKDLITYCLEHELVGLEEFSGIPGTVGGSVFINIHYFEFLLSSFLVNATVLEKATGALLHVDHDWFNFSYNYSRLHQSEHYLIDATFALKKSSQLEAAYAKGRSDEIIRQRARRYPLERTCGSFFRNFFESELLASNHVRKITHVAYYFDTLGFKGQLSSGYACVSHKHANMIVTAPQASSQDVINLARTMQTLVQKNFGITPQPECKLIGFKEHPLL